MNLPYILISILVLLVLLLGVFVVLKLKGSPLAAQRRPTRVQVGISLVLSVLLIVLWLYFDLTVALLPVLILPMWVPLFADREQETSGQRRLLSVLLALGVAVLVAIILFLVARER